MEAKDGTLLRRSQAGAVRAASRVARARAAGQPASEPTNEPSLYIPIPANCVGSALCQRASSPNTRSAPRARTSATSSSRTSPRRTRTRCCWGRTTSRSPTPHSGLFCAYNAGTTVVTISAGGLSASLPVTVQAGSVRRPCGTQPLKERRRPSRSRLPSPPPPGAGARRRPGRAAVDVAAAGAASRRRPPPPAPAPPRPRARRPAPPFFLPPAPPVAVAAVRAAARADAGAPDAAERHLGRDLAGRGAEEEEEEEATESVSNQAVAYRASEHEPSPAYCSGSWSSRRSPAPSIRRRPRRGRREVRVAPATISTMRAQRRMGGETRRRPHELP